MTTESNPHAALAAALAAFQKDIPAIAKERRADTGKYVYKYADLADVTKAALPLLAKHDLAFTTTPEHTEHGWQLTGTLMHSGGAAVSGSLPIDSHGSAQALGGSLTYARRYLLGCLTGVVTEDDADAPQAVRAPRQRPAARAASVDLAPMWAALKGAGVTGKDDSLAFVSRVVGREVASSADLSADEVAAVTAEALSLTEAGSV